MSRRDPDLPLTHPDPTRPGRDPHRPQLINMSRIAAAEEFYAARGYPRTPVPWVVGPHAYATTLPADVDPYTTLGGFLVASGEQSFLHLLHEGHDPGKAQCTTPCFRDEVHDTDHDPYFLKVELIRTDDVSGNALAAMIDDAETFLSQYTDVVRVPEPDGTLDLVCAHTGLELGSYGRRTRGAHTWLYGTGLAEPRLTTAIARTQAGVVQTVAR